MLPPPFHISVSSLRFLIIIIESLDSGDWRTVARYAKLSQDLGLRFVHLLAGLLVYYLLRWCAVMLRSVAAHGRALLCYSNGVEM